MSNRFANYHLEILVSGPQWSDDNHTAALSIPAEGDV